MPGIHHRFRHRLTDDAQAARAVERARDSVGDTTAMRTDDADAAIERAKRAMVLGRRVSEKTRKKRREEEDDDDEDDEDAAPERRAYALHAYTTCLGFHVARR